MTDLNKAREWAKSRTGDHYYKSEDTQAVIDLIQSLPDEWLDAEKVREVIASLNAWAEDADEELSHGRALGYRTAAENLATLLPAPKLPTLADMSMSERDERKWAQADMEQHGRGIITCILDDSVQFMKDNGLLITVWEKDYGKVTPLPDLPKLKWPSETPRESYLFGGTSRESDLPMTGIPETSAVADGSIHTPMQPSEVPANEPWLIEVCDQKAIGTRYAGNAVRAWAVAALDGSFANDYKDSEITLIHKLVPETHALPEGMRLADHDTYGRVVVSPEMDSDNEYKACYPDPVDTYGIYWQYVPKSELTFLDGAKEITEGVDTKNEVV